MFVSDCLASVNDHGNLTIGGRDAVELAETYGTAAMSWTRMKFARFAIAT